MKTIEQTYHIKDTIDAVWGALVNPKMIDKWGGGPSSMNDKVGTHFTLWGGDIFGVNTQVVQNKLLVQDWLDDNLEHATVVRFELLQGSNETILKLHQSNVPDDRYEDLSDGWREYYLGPLKALLDKS